MIHSVRFTCVLDTNVIHPIVVRDVLLWFAQYDLYTPKWSEHIFEEWINLMKIKQVPQEEIQKRISVINRAFPDAMVKNYHGLIKGLELEDEKDKHVLAAAIKTNANLIVTNNLRHFPEHYLNTFGLAAKSADDFATDIIDLNPKRALDAFMQMVSLKKKPELDAYQVLDLLRSNGMTQSANYLHSQL